MTEAASALAPAKLVAARLWAVHQMPYFAAGLFALTPVESPRLGTLAVDTSWRLYVDPDIVQGWAVEELGAVLVHEVNHLLRDHAGRGRAVGVPDGWSPAWNAAADAEINDDLVDAGLPLPGAPILPETLGCRRHGLAEEYLATARDPSEPNGIDCGSGAGGPARPWDLPAPGTAEGDGSETSGVTPAEVATLRRLVASAVAGHGNVPAGLARWSRQVLEPTFDWRRRLRFLLVSAVRTASGAEDWTSRRPSRRAGTTGGAVLPSLCRPTLEIAVVVDTSASMDDTLLDAAMGEVKGILRAAGTAVTVLACDTEVHASVRATDWRRVTLPGGGGTALGPGLTAAARLRPRPGLVVVLTDGYTSWPSARPPMPVIVALLGPSGAPPAPPAWATAVTVPVRESA
ncbi:MAG: vWA domain-containing protein [Acidimicrobiia bacterium]